MQSLDWTIEGKAGGSRRVREWPHDSATWVALLSHGYGEHMDRYEHVAAALHEAGAAALGPDHEGHGRSGGEQALIRDYEAVVDDLHTVADKAREKYGDLPTVLIGHSMGGMIAARYAQRYGSELKALVLSGPMFGSRGLLQMLLTMDPIPEIPIDPGALSRDPAVGEAYAADPLVWHGPFKKETLEAIVKEMDMIEAGPNLGALPTFWMHGEGDRLVPLNETRTFLEQLRGSQFEEKIYPEAMHELFNEINKEEIIGDAIAFLKRNI